MGISREVAEKFCYKPNDYLLQVTKKNDQQELTLVRKGFWTWLKLAVTTLFYLFPKETLRIDTIRNFVFQYADDLQKDVKGKLFCAIIDSKIRQYNTGKPEVMKIDTILQHTLKLELKEKAISPMLKESPACKSLGSNWEIERKLKSNLHRIKNIIAEPLTNGEARLHLEFNRESREFFKFCSTLENIRDFNFEIVARACVNPDGGYWLGYEESDKLSPHRFSTCDIDVKEKVINATGWFAKPEKVYEVTAVLA